MLCRTAVATSVIEISAVADEAALLARGKTICGAFYGFVYRCLRRSDISGVIFVLHDSTASAVCLLASD